MNRHSILSLTLLIIFSILISGCAKSHKTEVKEHWSTNEIVKAEELTPHTPEGMVPLNELSADYTQEQAIAEGCAVVSLDTFQNSGEDAFVHGWQIWKDFKDSSLAGETGTVRIALASPYIDTRVYDIEFDGEKYILWQHYKDENIGLDFYDAVSYRPLEDTEKDENGAPLGEFFNHYGSNMESAADDGCVIIYSVLPEVSFGSFVLSGRELWDEFYANTASGNADIIRIGVVFPSQSLTNDAMDLEKYYSYPVDGAEYELRVFELIYDGSVYTYKSFDPELGAEVSAIYPYLVPLHNGNAGAGTDYTEYTLMHTNKYNADAIMRITASSNKAKAWAATRSRAVLSHSGAPE
ncbi:MAG: hypothetical protein IKM51_02905 [Oscillospiraceae bacterium]|nr:hypothetical protein [Oscillospiraceae bacterium]